MAWLSCLPVRLCSTQRDGSNVIIAVWARSCDPAKQNRCPKGHMVNGPLAASPNHCERITIRSARSGSHQGRPGDGGKGDGCGDFPSNGGGRRVAANRPHRPCSVAPTIMVTVLPACLGRQGRHVVTSRPHAVSMTEPSQLAGSPDLTTPAELIGVHGLIGVSPDCTRGDTPRPDSTRGFRAL
ncbi:hypothetical protein PCASD_06005 [Puccinia coronata f. sp. avenae]|uniref:Uncharacterized protein n=1 Tax=Puccinia coronata f. sp. avenae TaxID=200324 RepID=A0A2N5VA33_9BASI|nr:hypothetical protein PCASD_06005 [Puccinia coronata f. sp. avenae]